MTRLTVDLDCIGWTTSKQHTYRPCNECRQETQGRRDAIGFQLALCMPCAVRMAIKEGHATFVHEGVAR